MEGEKDDFSTKGVAEVPNSENLQEELYPHIGKNALQMMKNMGYREGTGLGKYHQGITESIKVAPKFGSIGLGFNSDEVINLKESLNWLENKKPLKESFEKLQSFLQIGNSGEILSNSFDFCEEDIYNNIIKAKNVFNKFDIKIINKARARANPFEKIKSVFFMNRAALKLANIDAATNFMFSNIDENNDSKEPYYFADVCAGPGGFSEYIFWRKSWFFKGYGLTLKDENDFNLKNSCCISSSSFQALYGTDDDGNVCSLDNISDFKKKVLFGTNGKGVHFMTSDGGFCVDGQENFQEILSRNIYLCQCLVALDVLRIHGNFVTKLFDIFTRFSVGLIYLMYKCFKKVTIFKPNSSRPANAERYLICNDLQDDEGVNNIRKYFRFLAKKFWDLKDKKELDILEIVSIKKIKHDQMFLEYIKESNNRLGKAQIIALKKLNVFCDNPSLQEPRQEDLRRKSLEYWNIPDFPKKQFEDNIGKLDDHLDNLVLNTDWLKLPSFKIDNEISLNEIINSKEYWSFCPMSTSVKKNICNFYAGFSNKTCRWQDNMWVKIKNLKLTKGTLLYGEFVKETIQSNEITEGLDSYFKYNLHIIDAIYLGDVCLSNMSFQERMNLISIYSKSINQEFQEKVVHIRKKPIYPLSTIHNIPFIVSRIDQNIFHTILPKIYFNSLKESHSVNSILFLKHDEDLSVESTFTLRKQLYLETPEEIDLFNILIKNLESNVQ